jgi:DNA-binding MarR family transcriptional regulator
MTVAFDGDEVVRLRAIFGRMSRVLSREVDTSGLTRTQLSVVASLARYGPLGMTELSDIEGINPTMLSRIVAKLDDAGLIRRVADPRDRRVARVEVTGQGRAVHETLRTDRARLLAQSLDSLTGEQIRRLREALEPLEALVAHAQPASRTHPGVQR